MPDDAGRDEPTVERVLRFWFGENALPVGEATEPLEIEADSDARERWFGGGGAFDHEIESRFGTLLTSLEHALRADAEAVDGELLASSCRTRLARILILDQFSRNVHRETALMFATDDLALAETLAGLEPCRDGLAADARAFFLMPLMHSEDPEIQRLSVESFGQLVEDSADRFRERAESYLEFAERHRAIVDRFGRYPHRNALLGRASTPEEEAFLEEPGSSF